MDGGESSTGPHNEVEESILAYLSFSNDASLYLASPTMNSRRGLQRPPVASMQGVMWKRRDVFRNRWRPRWFVLHPQQGILTYYLLNENPQPTGILTSDPGSPINRRRADSDISMDTIDYDVVPRGSIFLGNPCCTVEVNETLTRVEERLYALTISDRESGTHCHLACRSSTARDRWLEKIQDAIAEHQIHTSQRSGIMSDDATGNNALTNEQLSSERDSTPPITKWITVESPDLTKGIPPSIAAKIDLVLETYLPFVVHADHPDFQFSCEVDGVKVTKHKSLPLLRSFYSAKDHHPSDYLGLVWDFPQASELEPNVRTLETLRSLNKHTTFVYTAYHSVWPSAPRDFSTVAHWRLLQSSEDETALCLVAFSCPEANKLKPPKGNHVRGTLHVSLHFWRPRLGGGCTHTRILAFDMNGKIPKELLQTIHHQQATLTPRAMDFHLQRVKSKSQECKGTTALHQMNYETMIRTVDNIKYKRKPDLRHDKSVLLSASKKNEEFRVQSSNDVNILSESLVLMVPLALQILLEVTHVPPRVQIVTFCLAVALCVRWVLIQQLLQYYRIAPPLKDLSGSNSTTTATFYRFKSDITTLLTFLENEHQVKSALGEDHLAELQVEHVLLRAVSKAMQKYPLLVTRSFPFFPSIYNVDIEWQNSSSATCVWIPSNHHSSIQSIADFTKNQGADKLQKSWLVRFLAPSCRVHAGNQVTADSQSTISVNGVMDNSRPCPVTIIVYPPFTNIMTPVTRSQDEILQESVLELSIIFQSNDTETCHLFVQDIQRSLQNPELCDT